MGGDQSKNFFESLNHAIRGVFYVLKTQKSLRIQFVIGAVVLFISIFLDLTWSEWVILSLTIIVVLIAEMFNTAVEIMANLLTNTYNPNIRIIKDIGAGAVLFASINAIFVGYFIFINKIFPKGEFTVTVFSKIKQAPEYITLICIFGVVILVLLGKALYRHYPFTKGGMPSGHSAIAFSIATVVAFISQHLLLTILTVVLAIMLAWSRIRSGIHTRGEVIMGSLIGILVTTLIFQFFN